MKNAFQYCCSALLLMVFGSVLFISCAREASPGEKAEVFLSAMSTGDLEKAKMMVDDESESVIITVEKSEVKINGKGTNIIVVEEDTKGEESVVKYKYGENGKINTIRLHHSGDDWQVKIDGDSEDIIIGETSLKEVLADVDITVEQALALSADAVEAALKVAGNALEEVGKALQGASEEIKINLEGSEEDIEKAKEEIGKAMEELQKALNKE